MLRGVLAARAAGLRANLAVRRMAHQPLIRFRHLKGSLKSGSPAAAGSGVPASAPSPAGAAVPASGYPPHQLLGMPALSPTMTVGNIGAWKVSVGDQVSAGDVLCEVETDKATVDFENQEDGYIAAILLPAGSTDVAVGTAVAVLTEEADDVPAFTGYQPAAAAPAAQAPTPPAAEPTPEPPAAPLAEKPLAAPVTVDSSEPPPLYYLTVEVRVDRALELSSRFDAVSWHALALQSACSAMQAVPAANSAWLGPEATRMWDQVDLEIRATDGAVRNIPGAMALGASALHAGGMLFAAGREPGSGLTAEPGAGGASTFTVDFLGDITFGRQRLGAGQSVSLTLSEPTDSLVPGDPAPELAKVVTATLSCDHRTVDGALGAAWLQHFSARLQNPGLLLL